MAETWSRFVVWVTRPGRRFVDWVMGRTTTFKIPKGGPGRPPPEDGERIGICVSGGGIRSASYCLGALQALQEEEVLARAEYLASVSGGGYIAGAMTMMAHSKALKDNPEPPPFSRGSLEEAYLRNHSSYLAPDGAGVVRLIARVLLGMVVNIALLASVLIVFGRSAGLFAEWARGDMSEPLVTSRPGLWVSIAALFVLGAAFLFLTALRRLGGEHDRFVGVARMFWGPALLAFVFVVAVPEVVVILRDLTKHLGSALAIFHALLNAKEGDQGSGSSGVAHLFGIASALGIPTLIAGALGGIAKKNTSKLALFAAGFVAPLLITLTVVASANDALTGGKEPFSLFGVETNGNAVWIAGSIVIFLFLYLVADLTSSSLHPFYKRRLASAFDLQRDQDFSSREWSVGERPYSEPFELSSATQPLWPRWVCCAAANTNDYGLTPPGRKAVSFTFEPDWIGSPVLGYVPTKVYEGYLGKERSEDVTIPAAIAISGAALSPAMGIMTKPALTFLLALFNARLGVWLPNPRLVLGKHYEAAQRESDASQHEPKDGKPVDTSPPLRTGPRAQFTWLFREMLGMNKGDANFLYVTDGGHWENLGLVELLRRGCTRIYCIDAAGDKEDTFFTIGQAISMARSELGVDIELDPLPMRPRRKESADGQPSEAAGEDRADDTPSYSDVDHVMGGFTYTRGPVQREGTIAFVKATVVEKHAWDIRAYKEKDPEFPNHGLLKQMFADQTFEAYRELGHEAAMGAIEKMGDLRRQRERVATPRRSSTAKKSKVRPR